MAASSINTRSSSVRAEAPAFPASQRELVAASLLARPDKAADTFTRPATWSRP